MYTHFYSSSNLYHASVPHLMGTRFDVLLFGASEVFLADVWKDIYETVERLESIFNRFDATSTVSLLNARAIHSPVHVDPLMWNVLLSAQHYNHLTAGLFDITLGFADSVILDPAVHTVAFKSKDVSLDFGGYAKGFALLTILDTLATHSITSAFLNFGDSSITALGEHPLASTWNVGVSNPYNKEQLLVNLPLINQSLSVSGNMPSHPVHICNPLDRTFIDSRKMSYVVAANPLDVEVLSTVAMVATASQFETIALNFELDKYKIYNEL